MGNIHALNDFPQAARDNIMLHLEPLFRCILIDTRKPAVYAWEKGDRLT